MDILVLYNNKGKIIATWSANTNIDLTGNLHMIVHVPNGYVLDKISVSGEKHVPIFISSTDVNRIDEKIQEMDKNRELSDMLLRSIVFNEIPAIYEAVDDINSTKEGGE